MKKKNIAIMAMFMMSVLTLLITVIFFEVKNYNDATSSKNDYVKENQNNLEVINQESINSPTSIEDNKDEVETNYNTTNELEGNTTNPNNLPNNTSNNLGNDISKSDVEQEEINMIFAGDFYFSGYILQKYDQKGLTGILSDELQKEFSNADIAMINEEFPFSERGVAMKDKQYTFRIQPKYVDIFNKIGIDIVTLANNHILDYGTDALLDTLSTLGNAGINYVGAGKNDEEAKTKNTYQFGDKIISILSASRVIPVTDWNATSTRPGLLTTYDPDILIKEITNAKKVSDYVIVYVHWGIEKHTKPEEYQRELARRYIDAGADVVVGSHPHVLQGIEYYRNKPIIYSLGNFMFYNSIDKTALLKIRIDNQDELHILLLPCYAEDACTTEITKESSITDFYSYIENISNNITIDENGNVTEN